MAETIERKHYAQRLTILIKFTEALSFSFHNFEDIGSQFTKVQHISDHMPHKVSLKM